MFRSNNSVVFPQLVFVAVVCVSFIEIQNVVAQPAPVSFTDSFVRSIIPESVNQQSANAVISAYRLAAERSKWDVKEKLTVHTVQPFEVRQGSGVQVFLARHDLGKNSYLFIASQQKDVYQRMNSEDLARYDMKSAFFPIGKLTISVITHGEYDDKLSAKSNTIQVDRLRVLSSSKVSVVPLSAPRKMGDLYSSSKKGARNNFEAIRSDDIESLCGSDDRSASDDRRIGRIMPIGCTGWLIGNNLALTAGHCRSSTSMNILEFQVPKSLGDGSTQPAHPDDQYPIIKTAIRSEDQGIGNDWAVFQVGPNSNTGKLPGEAQGKVFKLSKNMRPSKNATVTGFGVDETPRGSTGGRNKDNQTQQTENGNGNAQVKYFGTPSTGSFFRYKIDTTGGNSGSPDISGGIAFAIHTHGGCSGVGNHGTALDNKDLRAAIKEFVSDLSTVYVDENENPPMPVKNGEEFDAPPRPRPERLAKKVPILEGYPQKIRARLAIRDSRAKSLAPESVIENAKLWPVGREITVAFKGGTAQAYREIEKEAKRWAKYGNFSFRFRDAQNKFLKWTAQDQQYAADIRISFARSGYWSLLGSDSRFHFLVRPGDASMNLQGMSQGTLSASERGTVIHEFGHALGFHHEHQNPQANCDAQFRWSDDPGYIPTLDMFDQFTTDGIGRRPGIYTVLGGEPNNWDRSTVDHNLRQLPDSDAFTASAHDPNSIMHYSFDDWMFIDGENSPCRTSRNNVLSRMDIQGVKNAYPHESGYGKSDRANMIRKSAAQLKGLYWVPGSK